MIKDSLLVAYVINKSKDIYGKFKPSKSKYDLLYLIYIT